MRGAGGNGRIKWLCYETFVAGSEFVCTAPGHILHLSKTNPPYNNKTRTIYYYTPFELVHKKCEKLFGKIVYFQVNYFPRGMKKTCNK